MVTKIANKHNLFFILTLSLILSIGSNAYGGDPSHPDLMSDLEQNTRAIQRIDRDPHSCRIVFRHNFGLNNNSDFEYVKWLARRGAYVGQDTGCGSFTSVTKDALNHLVELAVTGKSKQAAQFLLFSSYEELGVDGELAEFYVETHMIKVILEYPGLYDLLDSSKKIHQVATRLCEALRREALTTELFSKIDSTSPRAGGLKEAVAHMECQSMYSN